ncbi:MAG: hypothetical protein MI741_19050 [Rhodospirillales bacterium]|nr:hypothetical protein [Rhodospirillales bacterium]
MRHIVVYDRDSAGWAVVDTESAHLVISLHDSRYAAASAAVLEERNWPAHKHSGSAKTA